MERCSVSNCPVCLDFRGFFARPCPSCGQQQPLDEAHARLFRLPVGHLVQPEHLAAWTRRRFRVAARVARELDLRGRRWVRTYEEGF